MTTINEDGLILDLRVSIALMKRALSSDSSYTSREPFDRAQLILRGDYVRNRRRYKLTQSNLKKRRKKIAKLKRKLNVVGYKKEITKTYSLEKVKNQRRRGIG